MNSLKTSSYKQIDEKEVECCICLVEYTEEDEVIVLPCNKKYFLIIFWLNNLILDILFMPNVCEHGSKVTGFVLFVVKILLASGFFRKNCIFLIKIINYFSSNFTLIILRIN